ncbi:MAG TPA: hypothetical protein VI215_01970 [Bacteroidota bacterium]|jgi:hypothetical protein
MKDASHRDDPGGRAYRLDLKRCIISECDGELAEISYYERNNWVTVELQCNRCRRKFVVKVEA